MDNFGYLFAAYSAIFAAIFLYVVFIWNRQSRLDDELRALEAKLDTLTVPPQGESGPQSGKSL
ncbi:MAG TPA: CcmD family protein [Candidatus Binataceae bacterium]|nr:CcmD family protein [Candidatus Binataceae bacterium]